MKYKVDNAIIMAAGTASRFAPLSFETAKALIEVKGEILIERQIRQLKEAGIDEIIVVVGYRKEQFYYLKEKFGVEIVENDSYLTRNNNASLYAVKDRLKNSYICSSDNYFTRNPFETEVQDSYYAAVYADGPTNEWVMQEDENGYISQVEIGGENSWYMLGHVFFNEQFSKDFVRILESVYDLEETTNLLWESIFMKHLDVLKMKIKKYPNDFIFEFDTLDELRVFDESYICDTRSLILKDISHRLNCREEGIIQLKTYKDKDNAASGFTFVVNESNYLYLYESQTIQNIHTGQREVVLKDCAKINQLIHKVVDDCAYYELSRMGGLTNHTYKIELENTEKYVVRIPGEGTEEMIVRQDEKVSTELSCRLSIDTPMLLFEEDGSKVSQYISGAITLNSDSIKMKDRLSQVADVFRVLHTCGENTKVPFEVFDMANGYEKIVLENNVYMFEDYPEVKEIVSDIKHLIDEKIDVQKVPCHNDPLCENWVLSDSGKLYLIDWEYAGMNDGMWDVSDVSIEATLSKELEEYLLEKYLQRKPTALDWAHFLANKIYVDYLWTLWAKTRVPFDGQPMEDWAVERYTRLKENIKQFKEIQFDE